MAPHPLPCQRCHRTRKCPRGSVPGGVEELVHKVPAASSQSAPRDRLEGVAAASDGPACGKTRAARTAPRDPGPSPGVLCLWHQRGPLTTGYGPGGSPQPEPPPQPGAYPRSRTRREAARDQRRTRLAPGNGQPEGVLPHRGAATDGDVDGVAAEFGVPTSLEGRVIVHDNGAVRHDAPFTPSITRNRARRCSGVGSPANLALIWARLARSSALSAFSRSRRCRSSSL